MLNFEWYWWYFDFIQAHFAVSSHDQSTVFNDYVGSREVSPSERGQFPRDELDLGLLLTRAITQEEPRTNVIKSGSSNSLPRVKDGDRDGRRLGA